jgi:hypothetical protein
MAGSTILHRFTTIITVIILHITLHAQYLLEEAAYMDVNRLGGKYIHDMFIDQNLLFTYVGNHGDGFTQYQDDCSVGIFDVSDPTVPVELGRKGGGRGNSSGEASYTNRVHYINDTILSRPTYAILTAMGDSVLHYFSHLNRLLEHNGLLYEFQHWRQTVNIYRVESPSEYSLLRTDTLNARVIEIAGSAVIEDLIYLTIDRSSAGLIILDVSDPDTLVELASPITACGATGIIVQDSIALVGWDSESIWALNVSDPHNPVLVFDYGEPFPHTYLRGYWQNDLYYLTGVEGISILNQNLEVRSEIPTRGNIGSIAVNGTDIIASTNLGIEIYDVANVDLPGFQSIYGANIAYPSQFDKQGDLLYVADLGDGLKIIDVSNPYLPKRMGGIDVNGHTLGVKVMGNYAYLADYLQGLIILDVSQPDSIQMIASVSIDSGAIALDLGEEEVYLISDKNELYVIDVSDKTQPEISFQQAMHESSEIQFGKWKEIVFAQGHIWLKFNEYPLYAYEWSADSGLSEMFSYDSCSTPSELNYIDSLLYLTTCGIQIIDPASFSFIRRGVFGIGFEMRPVGVAVNWVDSMLYASVEVVGWGGIQGHDMTDPSNPKTPEGYYGAGYHSIGYTPSAMLFEDEFLYALSPDGVGIYSPGDPVPFGDLDATEIINSHALHPAYPNPFNPVSTIRYELPQGSDISLIVYDLLGREVARLVNGYMELGYHQAQWDGRDKDGRAVPSGIYIARLATPEFSEAIKMVLLK